MLCLMYSRFCHMRKIMYCFIRYYVVYLWVTGQVMLSITFILALFCNVIIATLITFVLLN